MHHIFYSWKEDEETTKIFKNRVLVDFCNTSCDFIQTRVKKKTMTFKEILTHFCGTNSTNRIKSVKIIKKSFTLIHIHAKSASYVPTFLVILQ